MPKLPVSFPPCLVRMALTTPARSARAGRWAQTRIMRLRYFRDVPVLYFGLFQQHPRDLACRLPSDASLAFVGPSSGLLPTPLLLRMCSGASSIVLGRHPTTRPRHALEAHGDGRDLMEGFFRLDSFASIQVRKNNIKAQKGFCAAVGRSVGQSVGRSVGRLGREPEEESRINECDQLVFNWIAANTFLYLPSVPPSV
jgi:hypothetical protein